MIVSSDVMQALTTAVSVLWVLITVAAVLSATWLIVRLRNDPRVELGERLARGEIDVDDFRSAVAPHRG